MGRPKKVVAAEPVSKKGQRGSKEASAALDEEGFEILGGDNSPLAVGEVMEGKFRGIVRALPNKRKGQLPIPVYGVGARTIIASTVLADRINGGNVKEGDYLRIIRLPDAEAKKGQNAAKLFDVRVKRA